MTANSSKAEGTAMIIVVELGPAFMLLGIKALLMPDSLSEKMYACNFYYEFFGFVRSNRIKTASSMNKSNIYNL